MSGRAQRRAQAAEAALAAAKPIQAGAGELPDDPELRALKARFVKSDAAIAHVEGGQPDTDEQKAYYAIQHQRHRRQLQMFDGIQDWRNQGRPEAEPEGLEWAAQLDVAPDADLGAAFEALKKLDSRMFMLAFQRAGLPAGVPMRLSILRDERGWIAHAVAGPDA